MADGVTAVPFRENEFVIILFQCCSAMLSEELTVFQLLHVQKTHLFPYHWNVLSYSQRSYASSKDMKYAHLLSRQSTKASALSRRPHISFLAIVLVECGIVTHCNPHMAF